MVKNYLNSLSDDFTKNKSQICINVLAYFSGYYVGLICHEMIVKQELCGGSFNRVV